HTVGQVERSRRAEAGCIAIPHLVATRSSRGNEAAHGYRRIARCWEVRRSADVQVLAQSDHRSAGAAQTVAEDDPQTTTLLLAALDVDRGRVGHARAVQHERVVADARVARDVETRSMTERVGAAFTRSDLAV